ncbi:hypothetical protein D0Z08_25710 [Nocardioides immobilis]|uniref:Lipoprotein n=1 Tax=Nocardioides immobilis TaxID=2049295 RepID=A0A417XUT8_9ACTN|nr:hypothetical protein [Nocardioides immobilis]RHW24123.1 hypothetical protein D0Z08_25710 [Nocardioides immobilis]
MRSSAVAAAILGMGIIMTACGDDQPASTDAVQSVPCLDEYQPLVLEPSTAQPGQRLVVRYPSLAPTMGQLFMSRISSGECTPKFALFLKGDEGAWAEAEGPVVMMSGEFKRIASHPAVVPDAAEPGTYEVCAPAPRPGKIPACAVLTVEE